MKSGFPAHISGEKIHFVEEHLRETAKYASVKLSNIGLSKSAYLAGLLHDSGKFTNKFKNYIEAASRGENVRRGSVCHTFCGCIYLIENYHNDSDIMRNLTCEIIAYSIAAHHHEFDCIDLNGKGGFEYRINYDKKELCYDEAMENFFKYCAEKTELDRLFSEAVLEITHFFDNIKTEFKNRSPVYFMLGTTARMLLSAIVDADRRNTAEFMSGEKFEFVSCNKEYWLNQLDFYNNAIADFTSDNPINAARKFFSEKCYETAIKYPSGLYRLTLPTGAGKTLSAMRYAINHAEKYGKKRIIFIIPLLSILDQNSKVIKEFLPKDTVITEHHSDFIRPANEDELDNYELLIENWESPFIITTLFQFLNTLFSNKMSSIRRFSALIDSVIIIDEIQSLPIKTINMFCTTINYLSKFCGATVVLSSATQPNFGDIKKCPLKFAPQAEIVPYDKKYFEVFKRSEIIDKTVTYGMTIDELSDFSLQISENTKSLLIICNTKNSASALYKNIKMRSNCIVLFLSASMCMAHRKEILKRINKELKLIQNGNEKKIICVATQLVEAGVDFSFESVVRVLAGIDNAAQAAGRCNRSNEYNGVCKVYLVNLRQDYEKLMMLKDIAAAQRCTYTLLEQFKNNPIHYDGNLLGDKAVLDFYNLFYSDNEIKGQFDYPCDEENLYDLLSFNESHIKRSPVKNKYIINQSFESAGNMFKVFDENTSEIIVPFNDEAKKIIADLCSLKSNFDYVYIKKLLEKAKPYVIRIFDYQRRKLSDDGMIYSCADNRAYYLNELRYSLDAGLKEDDEIINL